MPFEDIPTLSTPRLLLRPVELSDAVDIFAYAKDPAVLEYTTGTTPTRVEEPEEWLRDVLADRSTRFWAIRLRTAPTVIGGIELGIAAPTTGSVHYALSRRHWSQGLITEALETVCQWALATLPDLHEIQTAVAEANRGSIRVLEKCAFKPSGVVDEHWTNVS